jgi:hypothetical protein
MCLVTDCADVEECVSEDYVKIDDRVDDDCVDG